MIWLDLKTNSEKRTERFVGVVWIDWRIQLPSRVKDETRVIRSGMMRSVFNSITAYQRNIIKIDKFDSIGFTLINLYKKYHNYLSHTRVLSPKNFRQIYHYSIKSKGEFKFYPHFKGLLTRHMFACFMMMANGQGYLIR